MWKTIKNSPYFLSFTQGAGGYEICVTDYICIWSTHFTETIFLSRLKENNDILMLNDEKEYIQKGLKLLRNPEKLKKYKIEKHENGQILFVSLTIKFDYSFMFECRLSKGSEEFFFHKITQPLLKLANDLRESQNELRNLLKKKDKEIEEYKEEGGEIVYRHLKTAQYNDENHMIKHPVYECTFGELDVPQSLIEKQVEIPQRIIVKKEPSATQINHVPTIKQEPTSQPIDEVSVTSSQFICKQEEPQTSTSNQKKRMKLNF